MIVWNEMEAVVSGSIDKFATCEGCGTEYAYTMVRGAAGHGMSLYMLDNAGARQRALQNAKLALTRFLETEVDPIPCPKCGHFQIDMIQEAQRRYVPWLGLRYLPRMLGGWFLFSFVVTILNLTMSSG